MRGGKSSPRASVRVAGSCRGSRRWVTRKGGGGREGSPEVERGVCQGDTTEGVEVVGAVVGGLWKWELSVRSPEGGRWPRWRATRTAVER